MARWFPIVLVLATSLIACSRGATSPPGQPLTALPKGTVLILPPRDMVQRGAFHAISPGSGKYLLIQAKEKLEERGWTVRTTNAEQFTDVSIPDWRQAVMEGRRLGSDYVLRLVLGEFRDAAPMTFRADYVTLQSGDLWNAKNGAQVWTSGPVMTEGTNLRSYNRLIDDIAEILADKMSKAEVYASALTAGEQLPRAAETANAGMGSCTVEQVLAMKSNGMTDNQVKRACTK